jgi:hypothetical protein
MPHISRRIRKPPAGAQSHPDRMQWCLIVNTELIGDERQE